MASIKLSEEQIAKFRSLINKSVNTLIPGIQPGEPIKVSDEQLVLITSVLGSAGTGREVKSYVELEKDKWQHNPERRMFMDRLLEVVVNELEKLEFFTEGTLQTENPLPSSVQVLNLSNDDVGKKIKMEEFISDLENVSNSSVFKR